MSTRRAPGPARHAEASLAPTGLGPVVMVTSWWPTEGDPHANPFVVDHARALQGCADVACWLVAGGCRQPTGPFLGGGVDGGPVATRRPRVPARLAAAPASARLLGALGRLDARRIAGPRPRAVVLQSFTYAGPYAVGLADALGCPLVYLEHASPVALRALSRQELAVLRHVARASTRVLAVSRYLASAMEDQAGLAPGSVGVVDNVVDLSLFAPVPPPAHPGTVVTQVADFRRVKDHGLLVDALLALGAGELARLGLRFVLVGDGPERPAVERRLAAVPAVAARVRFAGKLARQQVAQEMAGADWTLLTSRVETSSCVARESLSVGRPVIAPRVGALPEVIADGDGLLYDRTVAGLVDALRLAASGTGTASWQARSRRAASRFGPEVLAASYRRLLAEVAAR